MCHVCFHHIFVFILLCLFSCTALFVSISQVIGCEDRLRNDLLCVGWGVELYSLTHYLLTILFFRCGSPTVPCLLTDVAVLAGVATAERKVTSGVRPSA